MAESDWKAGDADWANKGVLKKFNQQEFVDSLAWQYNGLATYGYVYYPNQCYDGSATCKVHMFLHGCMNTIDGIFLGYEDLSYGGWLEYAAANDIIIIYPQARYDLLFNTVECFDF